MAALDATEDDVRAACDAAYASEFIDRLPNVDNAYVATAHAILRHQGLPVGKMDYLGSIG